MHDNGHRETLPVAGGGYSWWRYELGRRCLRPEEPPATQQLTYATTPPHGGSRTWSAICPPDKCLRQAAWRESGRPSKYKEVRSPAASAAQRLRVVWQTWRGNRVIREPIGGKRGWLLKLLVHAGL